jgi:Tfp pilus assembly protein PilE
LKDVIVAVVSIVIAVLGYRAWRIQFVSKERYSLARQALLKAYQIKEGILQVRAPLRYIDIDVLTNKLIEEPRKLAARATMTPGASKAAEEQSTKSVSALT